jgi:DNA-binding XRE family transcriptional regulator
VRISSQRVLCQPGERVAALRRAHNITQVQLAEALGVPQQTLQSNEVGRSMTALQPLAPEAITLQIATVRGQRVIVDADLATLYDVPTKRFNEAVKRNLAKFPADFMFTLSAEEFSALRSQFATSNDQTSTRGGRRYAPRVFTEHGALMAAAILNSPRAVEVSIYVVRAFVRLRELAATHRDLATRLEEIEAKTVHLSLKHDAFANITRKQLAEVFDALRQLMTPPDPPKRSIGFVEPQDTAERTKAKSKP